MTFCKILYYLCVSVFADFHLQLVLHGAQTTFFRQHLDDKVKLSLAPNSCHRQCVAGIYVLEYSHREYIIKVLNALTIN